MKNGINHRFQPVIYPQHPQLKSCFFWHRISPPNMDEEWTHTAEKENGDVSWLFTQQEFWGESQGPLNKHKLVEEAQKNTTICLC